MPRTKIKMKLLRLKRTKRKEIKRRSQKILRYLKTSRFIRHQHQFKLKSLQLLKLKKMMVLILRQ